MTAALTESRGAPFNSVDTPPHGTPFFRADVRPSTFDAEAQTVEVVFTTGAGVTRRDARGSFQEILSVTVAHLKLDRLIGASVLNGHRQSDLRDVIGVVEDAWIADGVGIARLRLSSREDVRPIVADIQAGIIRNISIGYSVSRWQPGTDANGHRTMTAIDWAPFEVSFVPVPADPGATVRSNPPMTTTVDTPPVEAETQIRSLVNLADLEPSFAETQIAKGATVDEARTAVRAELRQRSEATPIRVVASHDDPKNLARAETAALVFRAAGGTLPDDARQFVDMTFRDLAASSLERTGVSVRGQSTDEIFTRAMTTSDFPLIVSNAANKIALDRFNAAASGLLPLFRTRTLPNFKESTSLRAGELGEFKPLTESGEIQHTSRVEHGETMQLSTFAEGLNVSRKLLIDDDAGLLGDTVAALGDAAAATVSSKLAACLLSPGNLSDGTAVFHATRGNLAGTGAALSVDSLTDARKALRVVKGLDGKTIVGAAPKFLVVGPELETEAEQILASISPATSTDTNPFAGSMVLLVEPRLTGNQWFVFADPGRLPVLQMAYLSSAQGVQIQRTEAWDTLGLRFRAWLDFGCGWSDWRGAYRNAGAA